MKKPIVFTDIHWGLRSDSELHNEDCTRYIQWFIDVAKQEKADGIIFAGDWFENQERIGTSTINASFNAISELNELGIPVEIIVGNHDITYKTSRKLYSFPYFDLLDNVSTVNEIKQISQEILLCPYLFGSEIALPPDSDCPFIFGHYDFPGFLMNQMIEAKDHGGLHADHFYQNKYIFSGHFHKRQIKQNKNDVNICFIGNPFAHDFNDVGDRDRGCMILDVENEEPIFYNWVDGPNFNRSTSSKILNLLENDNFEKVFNEYSTIECKDDLDMEMEERIEFTDIVRSLVRNFKLIALEDSIDVSEEAEVDENIGNIKDITTDYISSMDEISKFDKHLLIDIFNQGYERIKEN